MTSEMQSLSHEAQLMTEANCNPGIEFTLSSDSASDSTAKSSQSKESDNEEDEKKDNDNKENENPDEGDSEEVEAGTKHVRRRFVGSGISDARYLFSPWPPQYSPFIQTQLHSDPNRVRTGLSRNFIPKNPLHPNLYSNFETQGSKEGRSKHN